MEYVVFIKWNISFSNKMFCFIEPESLMGWICPEDMLYLACFKEFEELTWFYTKILISGFSRKILRFGYIGVAG